MTLRKREAEPWTVIGIDNGTRLVAVEVPGGLLTEARIIPNRIKEVDQASRCFRAWEWGVQVVHDAQERTLGGPVHVFIEAPFVNPRTASAVIPLSQIQGAVMAGCMWADAKVYTVIPGQWKLRLFGKGHGNADKSYITEWMRVNWPWLHQWTIATLPKTIQQDALDAGGVARYGIDVMTRTRLF